MDNFLMKDKCLIWPWCRQFNSKQLGSRLCHSLSVCVHPADAPAADGDSNRWSVSHTVLLMTPFFQASNLQTVLLFVFVLNLCSLTGDAVLTHYTFLNVVQGFLFQLLNSHVHLLQYSAQDEKKGTK